MCLHQALLLQHRRGARRCRSALSAMENHTECDNEHVQAPVPKRAKANQQASNTQSTLTWKTETDIDMLPQTVRFLPARETEPQLSTVLDIASTNSFIVHKELHGNLSHKEFMEQLITELCGVSQKTAPKQTNSDHVPVPGAKLTSDDRDVATVGHRNCVHCTAVHGKRQLTPWKCQAYNVHLCLQLNRNCFQEWHKDV